MNIALALQGGNDRRRCSDTKLAEVISGAFALSYGIQAILPGASQWKVLLTLAGGTFAWGFVMILAAAMSMIFAYTHHYRVRFGVAFVLLIVWAAVVVLFSRAELAGPPLFNGIILMAVAVRVMIGAVRHEKLRTDG